MLQSVSVRAVAPPYPGAFTRVAGAPARILRTRMLDPVVRAGAPALVARANDCLPAPGTAGSDVASAMLVARCGGGGTLRIDTLEIDGRIHSAAMLAERYGNADLPLA